jgi:N-methylhydantoinase A/oxoprolinase/acetone carboxylase beta subunit
VSTLDYRLGIDVGGTNTDAVILDSSDQVRAKVKVPTTADVTLEPVWNLYDVTPEGRGADWDEQLSY